MSQWRSIPSMVTLVALVSGAVVLCWKAEGPTVRGDIQVVSLGRVSPGRQPVQIPVDVQNPFVTELCGLHASVSCNCLRLPELGGTIAPEGRQRVVIQFAVPSNGGPFAYYADVKATSHPDWKNRVLVTGEVPQRAGTIPSVLALDAGVLGVGHSETVDFLVWVTPEDGATEVARWEARLHREAGCNEGGGVQLAVVCSPEHGVAGCPAKLSITVQPADLQCLRRSDDERLCLSLEGSGGQRFEIPVAVECVPPAGWEPQDRRATERLLQSVGEQ